MALRILSGMLKVPRGGTVRGDAVITFEPFELSSATPSSTELRKMRVQGAPGRFVRRPSTIIAARQFGALAHVHAQFRIEDDVLRDSMTITWNNDGGSFTDEIPFIVVGEVPEGRPRRRPKATQLQRASGTRKKKGGRKKPSGRKSATRPRR
jgi:hypothetical protein